MATFFSGLSVARSLLACGRHTPAAARHLQLPALVAVRPGLFHTATPAASVKNPADAHGLSHWKAERALSVALVGLLPAAFLAPGPMVDYGLAVLVPLHNYMGMDVVFTDYVAKSLLGPAKALNAGVHIATVAGLVYFNLNDVGICEGLRILWSL